MKTRNFIAVFAVFMIAIMLGGCNAPINVNTSTDRADMVEQYLEASVTVIAKGSYNSTGSGIAIHSGGYIATNYHVVDDVIENPETGTVSIEKIVDGQFKSYDATILWYNEDFDLAVIRSSYRNIPYVKMEDRWIDSANPLRYTEEVWALGTPIHRSLYGTYSQGYISCAKPNLPRISQESGSGRIYEHLIQHTAAISSGSSGGGLFDAEGNLLGLNSLSVVSGSGTAN
ncbi:MAG: serine protease, partial [Clostridia bacterium]|nr:serine protease [Clostridia bacterium]